MHERTIDTGQLTQAIRENFPDVSFVYLFGSAKNGVVKPGSDIDIAAYYEGKDIFFRFSMESIIEKIIPDIPIDIVELQKAGPVLAFEVLCGTPLFIREECMEKYLDFYTRTCCLYEDEIYWMKKRLTYRGYEVQWSH
jgi:predicted nucleotidyltransferase